MSVYRPPRWLPGGHLQTLYPLLLKGHGPRYRRQRWETPDGDFLDADWTIAPAQPDAPVVVLFHGLEGSSGSHYARALMRAVAARGWAGVVPHFRGCSGEPNRLPRAYHSGDADEIDWILATVKQYVDGRPLFAAGVSLGGNALLRWAGSQPDRARQMLDRCAAVCAPLDLMAAGHALGRGFNRVYTRHFLRTLIPAALAKAHRFPGTINTVRTRTARTLYQFDDAVTAPLHGFAGVEDYWTRASAKPWLGRIQLPTLVINASNDPFLPAHALPPVADVSPWVTLEYPAAGGHVGFVSGPFPGNLRWLPERLLGFFDAGLPPRTTPHPAPGFPAP